MNMRAKARASIVFLQAHQSALFDMWLTNVTMQSWPLPETSRSAIKSMPILCQSPLAIGSGCRRPMGFPPRWLVRWHKSQPATYSCLLRHIYFLKDWSFMGKYVWSAPKCPPAGVSWASWRIRRCIGFGIHNCPLFSSFPSSSFPALLSSSFYSVLTVISPSSSSFFSSLAFFSTWFFSKSPHNHSKPFSSKLIRCADTHNVRYFEDMVDGSGRGLELPKE